MGRRSINTTKSGKYMNPTDQARKEARKQELKKNKKQRQLVRAAVLKGKDPQQILEELEKIDQMEYNVYQQSPLNEKVLREKRKKLLDTLDRVLVMYYKDDQEKWEDLKRKQTDYEHKRSEMASFYEAVRSAQQVQIEEIPLPQLPQIAVASTDTTTNNSKADHKEEHPIYSIATALKLQALGQPVREPPGCPPGPPPDIDDEGEVIPFGLGMDTISSFADDSTDDKELNSDANAKPSSLQQKMVAISGQNVDDFMKEMEKKMELVSGKRPHVDETLMPPGTEPVRPPMFVATPSSAPIRLPPGPPPGRPLPIGPPPTHIRLPGTTTTIRIPPPPRLIRLPGPLPAAAAHLAAVPQKPLANPNVLSAAPQLVTQQRREGGIATISAKPQIRSLGGDVTRFVPSTLRVKREDKKNKVNTRALAHELKQKELYHMQLSGTSANGSQPPTKDDAYKMFMEEMQNFL